MKSISLLLFVSIVLNACTSVTPAPAETALIVPTSAHKESPTPEMTATPSLTPTPEGPKEGDTRMKEGVGEQVYQVYRDREGNILYEGWVRVKTPGDGIPIQDYTPGALQNQMGIIHLVCSDKFAGCGAVPKFSHVDKISENEKGDVSGRVAAIIIDRLNISKIYDYLLSHPNGFDFSFFLSDPEHKFTWTMRPGPDSSVVEILTDWDDPILKDVPEIGIDSYFSVRSKILGVDKDGRLIGVVALNNFPPAGAEYIWNAVIFLHSSMVLQQEDLSNVEDLSVLGDIMRKTQIESVEGNPWVIMEPDN